METNDRGVGGACERWRHQGFPLGRAVAAPFAGLARGVEYGLPVSRLSQCELAPLLAGLTASDSAHGPTPFGEMVPLPLDAAFSFGRLAACFDPGADRAQE